MIQFSYISEPGQIRNGYELYYYLLEDLEFPYTSEVVLNKLFKH